MSQPVNLRIILLELVGSGLGNHAVSSLIVGVRKGGSDRRAQSPCQESTILQEIPLLSLS